jgi:aminoglycoside phosphotransferase (APT) family kinase protein
MEVEMDKFLEDALSIIKEYDTEVQRENFQIIGSGFGSVIIESDQGIIFRIAKNLYTARQYIMECKVLPQITNYLDINIPKPIWHTFSHTSAPYGIMAYRKLKGNSIDPTVFNKMNQTRKKVIAKEVANFIFLLHQVPYDKFDYDDIPIIKNDRKTLMVLRESTFEVLKWKLTADELRKMEEWWKEILSDDTVYDYKPTLCHGDTWYENILVDDSYTHVVGVIDFNNMMIGDPAVDLAPPLYLGKEFYDVILQQYTKVFEDDKTINQRIKRHQELREVSGLHYIINNNQIDEYDDAISKIRNRIITNT